MPWPAPDEFNEAVQNPKFTLNDSELQSGYPACNAMGLPIVSTGAFASVYRFRTPEKDYAVRCFLRELADRAERYKAISQFVLHDTLPATVDFDFIERGINVNGHWYPILKMEWVQGQLLNHYVDEHIDDQDLMLRLAESFREMVLSLRKEGLAHGDLQHGNILICGNEFRLVDYDGMYVPSLEGQESQELGHPNYQHPRRSKLHFGPYLDNFSSWIIYITLQCLCYEPRLWSTLGGGDERLLLGRQDFGLPAKSSVLAHLLTHKDPKIRGYGNMVLELLDLPPYLIPALDEGLAGHCQPSFSKLIKRIGIRAKATWELFKPKKTVLEKPPEAPTDPTFQTPDWVTTTQAQTGQSAKQGKWYEDWVQEGDVAQNQPPVAPNLSKCPAKANQTLPPAAKPVLTASVGSPPPLIIPSTILKTPLPTLAQWKKYSVKERLAVTAARTTFELIDILKNANHSEFGVACRIAALKCLGDETDARIFTVTLAQLIVDLQERHFPLLPVIQSSFEAAFINSVTSGPGAGACAPWLSRAYFQALDALVNHAARRLIPNLHEFIKVWFQVPRATPAALEDRLLSLFRQHHRSNEYRETALECLIFLLSYYGSDKNIDNYFIETLTKKIEATLRDTASYKHESAYMKTVAQETLARLWAEII